MSQANKTGKRVAAVVLAAAALCVGCNKPAASSSRSASARSEALYRDDVFASAVASLNRLDEFESGDTMEQIEAQVKAAVDPQASGDAAANPLLATWPQPRMLRQIVDRLNAWSRSAEVPAEWRPDAMLETLPAEYRELPMVADIDKVAFTPFDGFALREAAWLRDVSTWSRGERMDDLSRAEQLFDWTLRNIAIEPPTPGPDGKPTLPPPQVPWEAIYYGRGTAWERAWVFVLLARQQGIDAAVIALPGEDGAAPRPQFVAVLTQGNAYLFDPMLGLPIPAKDGISVERQMLKIKPATLAEVAADDSLLRQLDVGSTLIYPVKAEQLKQVIVYLEASPFYLSRRGQLVESRLVGEQKMVLSTAPSLQAQRWKKLAEVADVRLWPQPFETLAARLKLTPAEVVARLRTLASFYGQGTGVLLRQGRMAYFKGRFTGDRNGAITLFQQARPATHEIEQHFQKELKRRMTDAKKALDALPPAERDAAIAQIRTGLLGEFLWTEQVRQNAGFWLGTTALDRGNYSTAIDYFDRRVADSRGLGPWVIATPYCLARSLEGAGQTRAATETYRNTTNSPNYHGNVLRARWLGERL